MKPVKRLFVLCCVTLLSAFVLAQAFESPESQRVKYNFNSGWKLYVGDPAGAEGPGFDDAAWRDVTTPHAWNEDDAFKKDIKDLSTGVV
ncbi:MAG TPA: hypothetical protein VIW80_03680 [Pyrinomonadaceae bacterium]|jgi:hypothetical protein